MNDQCNGFCLGSPNQETFSEAQPNAESERVSGQIWSLSKVYWPAESGGRTKIYDFLDKKWSSPLLRRPFRKCRFAIWGRLKDASVVRNARPTATAIRPADKIKRGNLPNHLRRLVWMSNALCHRLVLSSVLNFYLEG